LTIFKKRGHRFRERSEKRSNQFESKLSERGRKSAVIGEAQKDIERFPQLARIAGYPGNLGLNSDKERT